MPTRIPDAPTDEPAAPHEEAGTGAPAVPEMPSFASLRDPRRRTAVDVLVPTEPAPAAAAPARTVAAPRPPDWSDLWNLGVHVTRTVAGVPARVVRWQARCLRTLLGR